MNRREQEALRIIYIALGSVSLPHDGSGGKSASIQGMVKYQSEMRSLIPIVKRAILTLRVGEEYDGELDHDIERVKSIISEIKNTQ